MRGFQEPQGIGYEPSTDTLYIANAGDGSVRVLRADDLSLLGRVDLGGDADNVRIDPRRGQVLVGYGNGAIAVIDPKTRAKLADIPLRAHPESFRIEPSGARAFVNVPDAGLIQVVDLAKGQAIGALPTQGHHANFPMALDDGAQRILIAFRSRPGANCHSEAAPHGGLLLMLLVPTLVGVWLGLSSRESAPKSSDQTAPLPAFGRLFHAPPLAGYHRGIEHNRHSIAASMESIHNPTHLDRHLLDGGLLWDV